MFHDRVFAGIINSPKTLINLRQVGDTLVLTGYMAEHEKDRDNKMHDTFVQTRVVVLKARKPEPSDKLGKADVGP